MRSLTQITSCETPIISPETLINLDRRGIFYLWATDRIKFQTAHERLHEIINKAAADITTPPPGWWAEQGLLTAVLSRSWKRVMKEPLQDILGAFDFSGDGKVDAKAVKRALKEVSQRAPQFVDAIEKKSDRIITIIAAKSEEKHWAEIMRERRRRGKVDKQEQRPDGRTVRGAYTRWLKTQNQNHLKAYAKTFPDRVLSPEVEKLVDTMQKAPEQQGVRFDYIQKRLSEVTSQESKWSNVTSVVSAFTWNGTGISTASDMGVVTYMIVNPLDQKTCPVCLRLHGTVYQVSDTKANIQASMGGAVGTDPDAETALLKQWWRFPRLNDVDNMSRKTLQDKGFSLPPYHGNCRDQIEFLGSQWGEVGETEGEIIEKGPDRGRLLPLNDVLEGAKTAGMNGMSYACGGDHFEDQNLLIYQTYAETAEEDYVRHTFLDTKLTDKGLDALNDAIENKSVADTITVPDVPVLNGGISMAADKAQRVQSHVTSAIEQYQQGLITRDRLSRSLQTINLSQRQITDWESTGFFADSHQDYGKETVERAALHYRRHLTELKKALTKQLENPDDTVEVPDLVMFTTDVTEKVPTRIGRTDIEGFTRHESVRVRRREVDQGTIIDKGGFTSLRELTSGNLRRSDPEIEFTLKRTKATVRVATGNPYALRGRLEVQIPKDATEDDVKEVLKDLRGIGLDARPTTKVEAEILYLRKMGHRLNESRRSREYKEITDKVDSGEYTPDEARKALRKYWTERISADQPMVLGQQEDYKLEDNPLYNPYGEYDYVLAYSEFGIPHKVKGGPRRFYRFDITESDLENEYPNLTLMHHSNSGVMDHSVSQILRGSGSLDSSTTKIRYGIPLRGMSPESDLDSGGGSYSFTRLRKHEDDTVLMSSGSYYFNKKLILRMDAVTYSNDSYGRVTEDFVQQNQRPHMSSWRGMIARMGTDETIIKDGIPLLSYLEKIVVDSDQMREDTITKIKEYGINELFNGKPIEDVIVNKYADEDALLTDPISYDPDEEISLDNLLLDVEED